MRRISISNQNQISKTKRSNQFEQLGRFNTSKTLHLEGPTNGQLRKTIQSLQNIVNQYKQKNQQLQQKLYQSQMRNIKRMNQFQNILQKYDNNLFMYKCSSQQNETQKLYSDIMQKFKSNKLQEQKLLEMRYEESMKFIDRKLAQITKQMKKQTTNIKKLSNQQNQLLTKQIARLQSVANQIQDQNQQFRKKQIDYQFKINLLTEEKKLLLQEVIAKKNMILYYKKLYDKSRVSQKQSRSITESKISSKMSQKLNDQEKRPFTSVKKGNFNTINSTLELFQNQSSRKISAKSFIGKKTSYNLYEKTQFNKLNTTSNRIDSNKHPNSTSQNIITSLKVSLAREKRRRLEQNCVLLKLQAQHGQIRRIIETNLPQLMISHLNSNESNQLQTILQSARLFKNQHIFNILIQIKNIIVSGNIPTLRIHNQSQQKQKSDIQLKQLLSVYGQILQN